MDSNRDPILPAARERGLVARAKHAIAEWGAAWRIAGPGTEGLTPKALMLDLCERLFVAAVFFSFAFRMLTGASDTPRIILLLLIVSETLPFVYIVLRAPSVTLSQWPTDWCFGILGTIFPMLVGPADVTPLVPVVVCLSLMSAGILLQIAAKLVLGRSFGIVAANRGVKVMGPYRFLRHPMYAGYTTTHVGFLLAMPSAMNALFYAMALTMQIVRILREERVLTQDPGYQAFAARVHYRLIPGIF